MSLDIHYHTCNFGTRAMKRNRVTGKMQSVSVADTLTRAERNAILGLLREIGTADPDKFGRYNANSPDGGSADVVPLEDGKTNLWAGLIVSLRVLTPRLAQLLWDFCRDGNMAAVPVFKDQRDMVLVASERQCERALARWSAPIIVESPEQFFRLLGSGTGKWQTFDNPVSVSNPSAAAGEFTLDLRADATEIRNHIVGRVAAFDPNTNDGPGEPAPIKMVYAGYEFDQSGWFTLIFDTRPDAAHDGEWTRHIDNNCVERPNWVVASELNERSPLSIRRTDGTMQELPRASNFGALLGEMIQQVMLQVRDDGVFTHLPMSPNWELGLEEFNGSYGWSSELGDGGSGTAEPAPAPDRADGQ